MKFKVGQKIRIILSPPANRSEPPGFIYEMGKFCGKVFSIRSISGKNKRYLYLSDNDYSWLDKWILPLSDFVEGDIVKVKNTKKTLVYSYDGFRHKDENLILVGRRQLI